MIWGPIESWEPRYSCERCGDSRSTQWRGREQYCEFCAEEFDSSEIGNVMDAVAAICELLQ